MKKNKSNLLIPAVIIIILIIVSGVVLMKGNILNIFKSSGNSLTRIDNFPVIVKSNKKIEKQRDIVNTQEEFNNLMNNILDDSSKVKTPNVDFSKNRLLVVSTATNETTGFGIKIKSILKTGQVGKLDAIIEFQKPGDNCQITNEPNVAIDVVQLTKDSGEITFDKEEKTVACK